MNELLIEIGVEELPAIPFLNELPNIKAKWTSILENYNLYADFEFFYTPRRLLFVHSDFLLKQPNIAVQNFGPPLSVAYKNGEATPALHSFIKKCGCNVEDLQNIVKDNKEILYFESTKEGQCSSELLGQMVYELLKSFNFGKSMRWGDLNDTFIRPVRWLNIVLAGKSVDAKIFDISSSNHTFVHRANSFEAIAVSSFAEYKKVLADGFIILEQDERRKKILEQLKEIEKSNEVTIEIDNELLDEVVVITEYPNALLGSFEEEFLKLPPDVIITSMKTNQRYFPVFKEAKLTNRFVVVSNSLSSDSSKIIKGNEKVLRARLSDAMFFYHNDIATGLTVEPLKDVLYVDGLGSIYEKIQRERIIGAFLAEFCENIDLHLLDRALLLAKADLATQMVYEFTELQGLVGYYYAKELGENSSVAEAIKEQYLPNGEHSALPSNTFNSIVAISNKLDSIFGLFSLGKIPSGTKDPFALRRAALGIVKIVVEHRIDFDIKNVIDSLSYLYKEFDTSLVENFMYDRFYQLFECNSTVIKACIDSKESNFVKLYDKIDAMAKIVSDESFKENFSTFKRVANISKDIDVDNLPSIESKYFENEYEKTLYDNFLAIDTSSDYYSLLSNLFALREAIELFFENCFVNAEDINVRNNRKALIASIYKEFKRIADIKEITL